MSGLNASPSSDQLQHQHNDRKYQKNVNEIPRRLTKKSKTEGPQNQQNDNNCPKHSFVSPCTNKEMVDE